MRASITTRIVKNAIKPVSVLFSFFAGFTMRGLYQGARLAYFLSFYCHNALKAVGMLMWYQERFLTTGSESGGSGDNTTFELTLSSCSSLFLLLCLAGAAPLSDKSRVFAPRTYICTAWPHNYYYKMMYNILLRVPRAYSVWYVRVYKNVIPKNIPQVKNSMLLLVLNLSKTHMQSK